MKTRKRIIAVSILASLSVLFSSSVFAADYTKSQEINVVGYAHVDTQWEWTLRDMTCTVHDTLENSCNLMEKNPGYKLNLTSAKHFTMMDEYFPDLMKRVKQKVAEGRLEVAGGWVEADSQMPTAESSIRQHVYAQQYWKEELNTKATHTIIPDNFGLGWNLPQILKGTGYSNVVTWRARGADTIYKWIGVDGTSVLSYAPRSVYNSMDTKADIKREADAIKTVGMKRGLILNGIGDAGGGPTQDTIDQVNYANQSKDYPSAKFITVSEFLPTLDKLDLAKVPTVNNGIWYICRGGYTTHAATKVYLRALETGLNRTESAAVLSDWLGASSYPAGTLMDVWDKLMVAQFHDTIFGTNIADANRDTYNYLATALNQLNHSYGAAINGILSKVDTRGEGVPLFIYNPLSVVRDDIIETEVTFSEEVKGVKILDNNGAEVPVQVLKLSGKKARILFQTKNIPSLGYTVYRAVATDSTPTYHTGLKATANSMENNYVLVSINPKTGNINRIYDKVQQRELVAEGKEIELHLMFDNANEWDLYTEDLQKKPNKIIGGDSTVNTTVTLAESGPLRSVIRVECDAKSQRTAKLSHYVRDIVLYANSSRIDCPTTVDWKEYRTALKLSVPMRGTASETTYDMSNGVVTRPVNDNQHDEVFGQMWADMTDESGEFGLSVLNNCKYGWDMPETSRLRLTLLRSVRLQDKTTDIGTHSFTYSFYPHNKDWRAANTPVEAHELNYPLTAVQTVSHSGSMANTFSFASVDQPNVMITAVKLAEESINTYNTNAKTYQNKVTLRLNETFGKADTSVKVTLGTGMKSVTETNLLEEKIANTAVNGNTFDARLSKFQLKTFVIEPKAAKYALSRPQQTAVDLSKEYNVRAIAPTGEKVAVGMGIKTTYPGERVPRTITASDISFVMGPQTKAANNAISCKGQTISLPKQKTKNIYLLAASGGDGNSYEEPVTVKYSDGTEDTAYLPFYDWNYYTNWNDSKIETPIAANYNHHHYNGEDAFEDPVRMYGYSVAVDSDKTVSALVLPNNKIVKVFAVSMGDGELASARPITAIGTADKENNESNEEAPSEEEPDEESPDEETDTSDDDSEEEDDTQDEEEAPDENEESQISGDPEDTSDSEEEEQDTNTAADDSNNVMPLWLILLLVGAAVLAVAGIVVAAIVIRKKKSGNQ